jgi:hypothetical protein
LDVDVEMEEEIQTGCGNGIPPDVATGAERKTPSMENEDGR